MKRDFIISAAVFPTILALFFLTNRPATAEIYRWVDENGVTHFSDRRPTGQDKGKEQVVNQAGSGTLSVVEGGAAAPNHPSPAGEEPGGELKGALNRNASVVIYTTDT